VTVVDTIGPLVRTPDRLQLFAFSAATWNMHRIHTDPGYAASEGYPDVLVQSHLHAAFIMRALRDAVVPEGGRVIRFGWQNRHLAIAGDTLTCDGRKVHEEGEEVTYELQERNAEGTVCVTAIATVRYA
jgi:hydroxyacyl-ACP dehydratase HTD2-like protein with hotdog domain